jgi:hypothetical protein
VGEVRDTESLVTEFQPFEGRSIAVIAFFGLLAWRRFRTKDITS